MLHRGLIYLNLNNNDSATKDLLQRRLNAAGWQVQTVTEIEDAKQLLEKPIYDVGLLQFPAQWDPSFYRSLYDLFLFQAQTQWIALLSTRSMDDKSLCEVIFNDCYDYHTLPIDLNRLLITLGHAHGMAVLSRTALKVSNDGDVASCPMVGRTGVMREVDRNVTRFANVDAPVLITGESGTGKELAARAIHARSRRANHPFVAVNCGSLPATLIQSELFGHEKGAFTGAHLRKIGRFEAAHRGTLFLDEIGDLPLDLQVNLLRVLEQGCIERLGSYHPVEVDVRIVTATHVDLPQVVANGQFRNDLYYRLNVLNLQMPALREREEDIALLARFFFARFRDEMNRPIAGFSTQALEAMKSYTWPGNVRELINSIRRAMAMCDTRLITPESLGLRDCVDRGRIIPLDTARAAAEREVIEASLRYTSNNVAEAARILEISRGTLYKLMEKLDINVRRLLDMDDDEELHNYDLTFK